MKLYDATTLAERIQRELQPLCNRIEIAGSIRRGRENVNDIDLVILPKVSAVHSPQSTVQEIKDRCKQRCRVITDGRQNFICSMNVKMEPPHVGTYEFQLDIFFAHNGVDDLLAPQPTNYGSLLLCRTGSREFNIGIASRAKKMDMHWNPYQGLFAGGTWRSATSPESNVLGPQSAVEQEYVGGTLIASETEEEIFKALGLEWIAPAYREVLADGHCATRPVAAVSGNAAHGVAP